MTNREALELKMVWSGPFGKFMQAFLKERADAQRHEVINNIPASQFEITEREQSIGQTRALIELLESVPQRINTLIAETAKKEGIHTDE